ncbi:unnamed protein product, partial [Laminaria digitata]
SIGDSTTDKEEAAKIMEEKERNAEVTRLNLRERSTDPRMPEDSENNPKKAANGKGNIVPRKQRREDDVVAATATVAARPSTKVNKDKREKADKKDKRKNDRREKDVKN